MKKQVYANKLRTIQELKEAVPAEIRRLRPETWIGKSPLRRHYSQVNSDPVW